MKISFSSSRVDPVDLPREGTENDIFNLPDCLSQRKRLSPDDNANIIKKYALRSFTGRARGRIGITRHSSLKKVMDHSDTAGKAEL